MPALSTGAAPRIAVEATDDASPLPSPTNNRLMINGTSEAMSKVHQAAPIPSAIRAKPPEISGMNPTRCRMDPPNSAAGIAGTATERSEEHTSELQSRGHLV